MADDFETFFKQATGCTPFPYQRRLADFTSDLPELLEVPTGTGKTAAAVLSWLWRRKRRPAETPRKLVYCLPMRVLVEQTRACAVLWLHRLGLLAGLADLDENGRVIHYEPAWGDPGKIAVATIMGGETADQWREHPESELLLIGTQDMLVSRALNRGYAAWPQEWPVEFGLLNIDSLWVMDEVQLMGPARTTSVQLQVFGEEQSSRRRDQQLPPRRTLWMSATMGAPAGSLDPPQWMRTPERGTGVLRAPVAGAREEGPKDENDLLHCEFAKRWRAPKHLGLHVTLLESAASLGQHRPSRRGRIKDEPNTAWTINSDVLVEQIVQEATSGPHRTVLVFVNRVDRARALFDRLSAVWPKGDSLLLLHARFRPRDRRVTERRLQEPAPRSGRIVVSTQVLEAGVDLDAHALFTEVCPWPSLVQRLGRLNRRGKLSAAPAVVFDVPLPPRRDGESAADYRERARRESSLPYEADELDITRSRLDSVSKQGGSVSPEALSKLGVSIELAGPVLRRFDLDDLFDTDPDLAGGHTDVAPFVRALDHDVDAYVLWRRLVVPPDDQPPVHPDELCGVAFYEVREAFAGQNVWILSLATSRRSGAAWRRTRSDEVRAGDTVMVDLRAGCYTEASGWLGKGQRARTPNRWVERWERMNGMFRAWARAGTSPALPSFAEDDIIDTHVDARRACGEDPRSYTKSWMELDHHLRKAEEEARDITVEALRLPGSISLAVCKAARWHDVGKALEREMDGKTLRPFQNMLLKSGYPADGEPRESILYAKSNRRGGPPSGFRHEVASALAYLARTDADDLVAYLIIAHHGKVRLLPMPWDDDEPVDVNGVRPGDVVPLNAVPETVNGESVRLDPTMFLASRSRSSWQGRIVRLLEELGPFGLAYLEALVRVADWRAS